MKEPEALRQQFPDSTRVTSGTWLRKENKIVLDFPDGKQWVYKNCGIETWQGLVEAGSKGRYLRDVLDHHHNHEA